MQKYNIPSLPLDIDLETKSILKQLSFSHRYLAELKGLAHTIPNEDILLSMLTLQEAKESSAVENIITTHDELYRSNSFEKDFTSWQAKEVFSYRDALYAGFRYVKEQGLLTNNLIKEVQSILEGNQAGFRTQSGTTLKDSTGNVIYTPPQDGEMIKIYMDDVEKYINIQDLCSLDPLVKMAIIHHQFESIHPFYDGNGRTGRIISVLYLVLNNLLDLPILYLSQYIIENKAEYYKLLQSIRDSTNENKAKDWENWVLFNLKGIEITAKQSIELVNNIQKMMQDYKSILRPLFAKQYKHALLNNLFFNVYTKIEFIQDDLQVTRQTAANYLDRILSETDLLEKVTVGRTNYYINTRLYAMLTKV